MHALPNLPNSEAFKAWRADASRWLPTALDIARGHRLPHADPHPFLTGTNLVVGLDGLVLKIFPPMLRAQYGWKNLEHQAVEADDKIGAGQERMGIGTRQPVAARNVEG